MLLRETGSDGFRDCSTRADWLGSRGVIIHETTVTSFDCQRVNLGLSS